MKVVRHNTAAEFLAKAGDWLEQAEAENNLILGIAAFFASYSGQVKVEPYLLTAQDDDACRADDPAAPAVNNPNAPSGRDTSRGASVGRGRHRFQVCSVLENAPDSLLKIGSAEQDHHRV